jgi:hypothetical protein
MEIAVRKLFTRILLGLLVLAVVLGFGAWWLVSHDAINKANFAKIHHDLTLAEVQALLGKAPDLQVAYTNKDRYPGESGTGCWWESGQALIYVHFAENGSVADKIYLAKPARSLWAGLEDRFGW